MLWTGWFNGNVFSLAKRFSLTAYTEFCFSPCHLRDCSSLRGYTSSPFRRWPSIPGNRTREPTGLQTRRPHRRGRRAKSTKSGLKEKPLTWSSTRGGSWSYENFERWRIIKKQPIYRRCRYPLYTCHCLQRNGRKRSWLSLKYRVASFVQCDKRNVAFPESDLFNYSRHI